MSRKISGPPEPIGVQHVPDHRGLKRQIQKYIYDRQQAWKAAIARENPDQPLPPTPLITDQKVVQTYWRAHWRSKACRSKYMPHRGLKERAISVNMGNIVTA